jgi:hypothetical protein
MRYLPLIIPYYLWNNYNRHLCLFSPMNWFKVHFPLLWSYAMSLKPSKLKANSYVQNTEP